MKHLAFGWACNFKDLFVRFPYNKCKYLFKRKGTKQRVNQIFRTGLEVIVNDIVENGVTFINDPDVKSANIIFIDSKLFENRNAIAGKFTGEEFKRVRSKGKFKGIDFLETLFTGYQLYFYSHGKKDNFLFGKKIPIYLSGRFKKRIEYLANAGKTYG